MVFLFVREMTRRVVSITDKYLKFFASFPVYNSRSQLKAEYINQPNFFNNQTNF